jgi:hypothetical protein
VRRSWVVPVIVVVALAAATVALVLLRGGYTNLGTTTTTEAVTTTTDKNAFVEVGDTVDLAEVTDAKFASVTLTSGEGAKTYMVAANQASFVALAAAVAAAEPVNSRVPSGGASLVFAFEDRRTITFDLDTAAGLIGRAGKAWRPDGDLATLVEAVATAKE